mmetsp:Transcript_35154/g.59190  ORF Transcript_35154/g.59190 Transcript_35154/m.59190 type:complete len:217 (+) Transcript_35154:2240-2890(+)
MVRPQGAHLPHIGGHAVPRRHGAPGGWPQQRHQPLPAPLHRRQRLQLRHREHGNDLLLAGGLVHEEERVRGRHHALQEPHGRHHGGRVPHRAGGAATHAGQVALHLQPARHLQGVPGGGAVQADGRGSRRADPALGARNDARVSRPADGGGGPRMDHGLHRELHQEMLQGELQQGVLAERHRPAGPSRGRAEGDARDDLRGLHGARRGSAGLRRDL